MADEFWLSDAQWERLAPLLPNKPRGVPRVDDRRVISGIIHVLKSGGRLVDAPACYGPRKTLYNRFVRWAAKDVWIGLFHTLAAAGGPPAAVLLDFSAVKAHRCASGGKGGSGPRPWPLARRTDDEDPCPDRRHRPTARVPTDRWPGGGLPDGRAAPWLPAADVLVHAYKAYDNDRLRRLIEAGRSVPNIPPKADRIWKNCFSPYLYRYRNAVERMFGRLKDFRCIANRYDRLARNDLSAVCLAATVSYWL